MGVTGTRATVERRSRDAGRPHPGGRPRPAGVRGPRGVRRAPGGRGGLVRRRRHRRVRLRPRDARGPGTRRESGRWPEDLAAGVRRDDRARDHPEPHAGRVAARAAADPRLRAVHRAGHRGRRHDHRAAVDRPRRRPGRRARYRRLGGAVRHRRRPDLPRDHLPGAYFGEDGHPLRAFAIWEGGLGIWGAIALGGRGRLDRLPAPGHPAAGLRRRGRSRPADRPGDRPARATGSTTSSTAAAPTCRGA